MGSDACHGSSDLRRAACRYNQAGSEPGVLLLHGLGGTAEKRFVFRALAGMVRPARSRTLRLPKLRDHLHDGPNRRRWLVELDVVAALLGKHLLALR